MKKNRGKDTGHHMRGNTAWYSACPSTFLTIEIELRRMNGLFFASSAGIVLSETLKGHRPGPLGIRSTLQALNFGDAGITQ